MSTNTAIQNSFWNLNFQGLLLLFRYGLLAFFAIKVIIWLKKYVQNRRIYNHLPTIPTSTFLGNFLGHMEYYWSSNTNLPLTAFFGGFYLMLTRIFQQQKVGLFYSRFGPFRHNVFIIKARAAEMLLTDPKNLKKSTEYNFIRPWLGQGLLTSQGNHWQSHRKLLTSAFHFEILEKFLPAINAQANTMVDIISSENDKVTGITNIKDIKPIITNCTLDILCETAMGIKMSTQEEWWTKQKCETAENITPGSKYAMAVRSSLDIILARIFTPWMHNDFLFGFMPIGRKWNANLKILHDFTNSVIFARKKELEVKLQESKSIEEMFRTISKSKRVAFLDLLLEHHFKNPKEMSLQSIREEVDTFMFAGHDTTSSALQFAFLLIGLNQDKQRKIQAELDDIFGIENREIALEDIKKMTYLDMAIRESMRYYPPVSIYGREIIEEFEIDGFKIPVGTMVSVNMNALHNDPEVYDQPKLFLPERFEPNSRPKNPFEFIPFSAGVRNCIGQRFALLELKVVLATVLRRFNIRTITKQDSIEFHVSLVCKTKNPIEIEFTERR